MMGTPSATLPSTPSEAQSQPGGRYTLQEAPTSRPEWINEWRENNPGRPAPCSAKAAYRLADRMI